MSEENTPPILAVPALKGANLIKTDDAERGTCYRIEMAG